MKAKIMIGLCAVCAVAGAATVTLNGDSMDGFVAKSTWSSGKPPEAGNDYIVAGGHYLHGDYSEGFAGDSLQFGIVGGSEGVFFKEHKGTHTFTKLILANGYYRTWMSSNGQAGHIAGLVQVTSPESAPFRLHSTHNSGLGWWITYWDAAMTGAEGTGLRVGPCLLANAHLSQGQTIFTGDNSGYLGSIAAYGTNAVFAFTTGNSLGGALSSFKADALSLSDGTTLECQGADVTLAASLNRGLTVEATGGKINVPESKSLRLEWPIAGTGPLAKTGTGILTLTAAMNLAVPDSAAALTVSNGNLRLAAGFSNSGKVCVSAGAEISVAAGDEVEVQNLAFEGGAIRLTYDEATEKSGVLVLGGACSGWPIPVYTLPTRGLKVPFLKVPTSIKTVTAADFAKPDDLAATDLPSAKFTVETEGSMQTVYAEMSQLVTVSDGYQNAYFYPYGSEKARWSDNNVMHAGADYLIGGGKRVDSTGMTGNYKVLGDSITFAGASSSSMAQWNFGDGNGSLNRFTGDVRAGNYAKIYPKAADGGELHLDGRLYVYGTEGSDRSLDFRAAKSGITVVFDSVISGSGWMSFQPPAVGYTNTYCFAGDNTFNGVIFGYQAYTNTLTTIKFAKESSWGTDGTSLRDSIILQGNIELYPGGSQTVNLQNRRIKFYSTGPKIRVDDGEVFDLRSPLFFNNGVSAQNVCNVKKVGGGTWAIGGAVTTDRNGLADWPRLTVEEGFIRPDNPVAFRNIAVTVGENGGIAAKYRPGETSDVATYGMIVTNAARLAVSGEILKFKVETGGERISASERISLLTVPGETATAIDAKRVVFEHDDSAGRTAVLERDEVTYSSKPYIRYSCRFIRGLKIILR